ncbi:flagellin [Radiobacillus kanasensis]|uniref:flagellin N-terminal helical domain-containing protein n=1 Tax=Radiobacillus kanasensis TaxID=2844358 RepID=UPI001E4E5240|nr:flagellin [Radiobacillus kanasensis]UFT98544.1 flagellin [Radiobacillus kanasensis]
MRINHNIAALNTYRQLNSATNAQSKSMEKLSSGLRINRAGDDAAGLAISEKMRGQIRGLEQAERNAQDGISLIQTAEGALNETHSILQRMRELAVQSSNDTNTNSDRAEIQKEIDQLGSEIDRIANTTEFNTQRLLDGNASKAGTTDATAEILSQSSDKFSVAASTVTNTGVTGSGAYYIEIGSETTTAGTYNVTVTDSTGAVNTAVTSVSITASAGGSFTLDGVKINLAAGTETGDSAGVKIKDDVTLADDNSLSLQIGSNTAQTMGVDIRDMSASALQVSGIKVDSQGAAEASITAIESALREVSTERSKLGSFQNRLEHTINNLGTSAENLTASESRIRDVDMAKEMMNQTKNSILAQAAQAMLAQANQQPQGVLQLLR